MNYILLADGFEEVEALTVVDMLRRADIKILTVSINDCLEVTGAHDIKVLCDINIDDVSLSDSIILPGGIPGVPNLASDKRVLKIIEEHFENNKLIAAICAAPTLLNDLGILNNKRATCYPTMFDKLTNAQQVDEKVVVENNVITSKAPGTAFEFAYQIITYLKDKETAEAVKKSAYFI